MTEFVELLCAIESFLCFGFYTVVQWRGEGDRRSGGAGQLSDIYTEGGRTIQILELKHFGMHLQIRELAPGIHPNQ